MVQCIQFVSCEESGTHARAGGDVCSCDDMIAVLTYKALNGLAPPYLSSAFTLVADVPS